MFANHEYRQSLAKSFILHKPHSPNLIVQTTILPMCPKHLSHSSTHFFSRLGYGAECSHSGAACGTAEQLCNTEHNTVESSKEKKKKVLISSAKTNPLKRA